MRRTRFLFQALILSGTLNIGLLSTFVYFSLKKSAKDPEKIAVQPSLSQGTNELVLQSYSLAAFSDLLLRLENKDLMEEGFYKRDLALSCLVAFHYFPLERALGGESLQKRRIAFRTRDGEIVELMAFTGLTDEHFAAISQFAKTEKWPLSTKGLFWEMQKGNQDPSLLEAFYCTPEFHSLLILMQKKIPDFTKALLVELLKEGGWKQMQKYADQLRMFQCYTEETFKEFLTACALESGSKIAADILCVCEGEYLVKRWEDAQLVSLLDLYEGDRGKAEPLALELLQSQRSDGLRKRAALFLYAFAGETPPDSYSYEEALHRFGKKSVLVHEEEPSPPPPPKTEKNLYKIQEGDSLWKIARRHGVSVESIRQVNHLETDRLRVGKELEIPKGK